MKRKTKGILRQSILMIAIVFCLSGIVAGNVHAETMNLLSLPSTTYGGYYVGGIQGNINGGYSMNFYCNDFATTSYVPSSFAVAVSTLSDLSQTKFGGVPDATFKYQQVAWLVGQMESNPSQVGPIQFAAWSIFTPSTPSTADSAKWVTAAGAINPSGFDFSSVRIYTPTNSRNQEFISGGAKTVAAHEPGILSVLALSGAMFFTYRKIQKMRINYRMAK